MTKLTGMRHVQVRLAVPPHVPSVRQLLATSCAAELQVASGVFEHHRVQRGVKPCQ